MASATLGFRSSPQQTIPLFAVNFRATSDLRLADVASRFADSSLQKIEVTNLHFRWTEKLRYVIESSLSVPLNG
jgi:hypothetical protein